MSERPLKKRRPFDEEDEERNDYSALKLASPSHNSPPSTTTLTAASSKSSHNATSTITLLPPSTQLTLLHQQQQIDNLRSELQHEQVARSIEAKQHQQHIERLEQQVRLSQQEAQAARDVLAESVAEAQRYQQTIQKARDDDAQMIRLLQQQLQQANDELDDVQEVQQQLERCQREKDDLVQKVQSQAQDEALFQQQIQDLKRTVQEQLQETERTVKENQSTQERLVEDAPPSVMNELNRTRMALAESERAHRQVQKELEVSLQRNRQLLRNTERSTRLAERQPRLQADLDALRSLYEEEHAQLQAWKQCATQISDMLKTTAAVPGDGTIDSTLRGTPVLLQPPTLLRRITKLQDDLHSSIQSVAKYKAECDRLRSELLLGSSVSGPVGGTGAVGGAGVSSFDSKKHEAAATLTWSAKERDYELQLERASQQVQKAQLEATLFQREADSLRLLIQTFEQQMERQNNNSNSSTASALSPATGMTATIKPTVETIVPPIQIRLDRVSEQLKVARETETTLRQQLETSQQEQLQGLAELDRVRTKFVQLRQALATEKEKVLAFEGRVVQAEQLAGKGSFDPQRTRVLHLTETPLVQALKEQIHDLQLQLLESSTTSADVVSSAAPLSDHKSPSTAAVTMNPDKLNQRLKETFKEQIAIFREAVYLMTGYKVDMLTGMDRPTFRLRSVFAEQEEDQLLLQWPKAKMSKNDAMSLDILQTDLGKQLTTTPSYEYMTKFHSLPAFLASVQLSLFEKQTVVFS